MKKYFLFALSALVLASCESQEAARKTTASNFKSPVEAGTLPDGRKVKYVVVEVANTHDHYIYFVDNVISVNRNVSQGKTTSHLVTVLIDGVEYVRKDAVEAE